MKHDNVVPFDPMSRGGMARRGAPDKNGPVTTKAIVLRCPSCAAELRLEAAWIEGEVEVLCGRCETAIPLVAVRQGNGSR